MIKLILMFFLGVNYSYALDPNSLIESEMSIETQESVTCSEDYKKSQALAISCVEKICGPANKIKPAFLKPEYFDQFDLERAEKKYEEFKPKIKQTLINEIEFMSKVKEEFLKRLQAHKVKLNNKEASLFLLRSLSSSLVITRDVDTDKIEISLKPKDDRTEQKKKVIHGFIERLEKALPDSNELKLSLGIGLTRKEKEKLLLDKMYEIDEAMLTMSIPLVEEQTKLLNMLKTNIAQINYLPLTVMDFISKRLDEFKMSLGGIQGLSFKEQVFDLCNEECLKYLNSKEFQDELYATFKEQTKDLNDFPIDLVTKACKTPFYLNEYNNEISKKHTPESIMGEVKYVASTFSKFVEDNLSRETAKEFNTYIQNFLSIDGAGKQIYGPPSQTSLDNFTSLFEGVPFEGEVSGFDDFSLLGIMAQPRFRINFADKFCVGVENGFSIGDDFYHRQFSKLNISSHSCDNPYEGRQLIAHELGHVLSHLAKGKNISKKSSQKFLSLRECVSTRHLIPFFKENEQAKFNSDHFKSEEDFADYLASKAFTNYNKFGNPILWMHCSYLNTENSEYSNLKLKPSKMDNHSIPLFRLINSVVDKGGDIPKECDDILAEKAHLYAPIKCE